MEQQNFLVKKLGFWQIWALGVGAVVGDGIFLMVAQAGQTAGPSGAVAYFVAGILLMCVCMAISEMAVGMPTAGAMYNWSKRILGPVWGVAAGLGEMLMNVIFLGSVSLALGAISNYFFTWGSNETISALIWAAIFLSIVVGVALLGGEITGKSQLVLVIVLVGIMLIFALVGLFSGKIDGANYKPFAPFGFSGMWAVLGMGVYAYMGPLALLTTGGEVKKIRDLPRAMFWAFVTFIILYTGAIIVMMGLCNYQDYSSMESPFTTAAAMVFGNAAGVIINLAAWLAAITCLVGEVFCASRLMYGMGENGALPKAFTKLNKHHVPYVGIIVSWAIGMALIIIGSSQSFESFYVMLVNLACVAGTLGMLVSVIASVMYKKKFAEEYQNLSWHLPLRPLVIFLAFAGTLIILVSLWSDISILVWSLVLIALVAVLFFCYSKPNIAKADAAGGELK